jgi:tRNA(Glu) U13 pseudouridine synthase TruD
VCVHVCSLLQVREQLTQDGMDIGNFERVKKHLHLGSHSGNRFKVVLRSIRVKAKDHNTSSSEERVVDSLVQPVEGVTSDLQSIVTSGLKFAEASGFVNYFGLQRLNHSLMLPRVGLAILHNDLVSTCS